MAEITFKQANARYRRLFFPIMGLYAVICIGGALLFKAWTEPPAWFAALVALATSAPVIAVFWLIGRNLRETDEYTRQIQIQALLTGGAITLSIAVIWGFLELYRVLPRLEHLPSMMMVAPCFLLTYGLSYSIQQLRRGASLRASLDPACIGADDR